MNFEKTAPKYDHEDFSVRVQLTIDVSVQLYISIMNVIITRSEIFSVTP